MAFHRATGIRAQNTDRVPTVRDFATTTFETQLSDNEAVGQIIEYGTGTTAAGKLYFLHTDGSFDNTDASAAASGATQTLCIALSTAPADGMLRRGYMRIDSTLVNGSPAIGAPVYVSTTANEYTFTAPTGANDFVRCVGTCLDVDGSDILLDFDPSHESIVLA